MKTLSVVIPCYNEAKNIPLILQRFAEIKQARPIEVILVDNGSTDESAEALRAQLPAYPFARAVALMPNQGYGGGIIKGLQQAGGDFIGWTHADLQTDPQDVARAYDLLAAKSFSEDLFIKGLRRGRPLGDEIFTVGMSCFESLYLGAHLWDINAQPNIFSKGFFEAWKNPPADFSLDLYAFYLARRRNLDILRFPVRFGHRRHGASKWNTGFAGKKKFIQRTLSYSKALKETLASCS